MGSGNRTGAGQPHDWQAAWPIRADPEATWESPEGGEGAENQSLGWTAPGHVGQDAGHKIFLPYKRRHLPLIATGSAG